MQEYIETYSDSFVDYAGNVHHFVIAAISKNFSSNVENKKKIVVKLIDMLLVDLKNLLFT